MHAYGLCRATRGLYEPHIISHSCHKPLRKQGKKIRGVEGCRVSHRRPWPFPVSLDKQNVVGPEAITRVSRYVYTCIIVTIPEEENPCARSLSAFFFGRPGGPYKYAATFCAILTRCAGLCARGAVKLATRFADRSFRRLGRLLRPRPAFGVLVGFFGAQSERASAIQVDAFREPGLGSRAIQRPWSTAASGKLHAHVMMYCGGDAPPHFPNARCALLLQEQYRTHMVCEHAAHTTENTQRSDFSLQPVTVRLGILGRVQNLPNYCMYDRNRVFYP